MPDVRALSPVAEPALRVPVRFAGAGAGLGELSWGQREMWRTILRQRSWLPIGGWSRLAPGTSVEDVASELRWIMRRYPTTRTRLRFAPGGGSGSDRAKPSSEPDLPPGRALQSVAASGTIALEVYDCPDEGDPEAFVAALDARDRARPYDFVEEWPIRMAVVRHRGAPTHLSTVMTHLVTDGLGGRILLAEVADRAAAPEDTGTPPLEQARWQGSEAGRRQNASALRHWERTLRRLPAPPPPSTVDGPRYYRGELRTRALPVALHVLSERADVDSSQVLMTLLAMAAAAGTRRAATASAGTATGAARGLAAGAALGMGPAAGDGAPVVLRPMVSNRFRRGLDRVVAMVAQRGICAADVAGVPYAEALRRVGAAAMAAYKYAYVDPDDAAALADRLGADPEAGLWFNDRRVATRQGFAGAVPTADELRAAPPASFRWTVAQDDPFDPLSVDVDDAPDGFLLTVFTDAGRLSPAGAEALVREAEALGVHEAALLLESEDR
ncbi:hypothetical protein [Dactylosporangium sp. CA-139066]|uniref:hypothetical protein n=1 Tax=Dactylosporangium sp. CA-139066 TaxID=3239930 RepID=UPI003D90D44C